MDYSEHFQIEFSSHVDSQNVTTFKAKVFFFMPTRKTYLGDEAQRELLGEIADWDRATPKNHPSKSFRILDSYPYKNLTSDNVDELESKVQGVVNTIKNVCDKIEIWNNEITASQKNAANIVNALSAIDFAGPKYRQ